MPQNEVRWLLETVVANWPETLFPEDLVRVDSRDSEILESGRRTKDPDLTNHNIVSADLGNVVREPYGTNFDYEVQTILDVEVVAHIGGDDGFGHVVDSGEFEALTNRIQYAINESREYPTIDPADDDSIGSVQYYTAFIEDEQDLSGNYFDEFRTTFSVRLRGRSMNP